MRMARALSLFCCSQSDETRNVLSLENPKHLLQGVLPWVGSYRSATIFVEYAYRQGLKSVWLLYLTGYEASPTTRDISEVART